MTEQLSYSDGETVELFDHVSIGEPGPSPFFSEDWEINEHEADLPEGQVTKIMPRKKQIKVRYVNGYTRRGDPKFVTETLSIDLVNLVRRDG
jgi:hypothetical protein